MEAIAKDAIEEVIAGCIKNDRRSQHKLYVMFYSKLMGVCLRYAQNESEAQDIVQEGFIKVFNKLEGYNNIGSFEGWVKRIVVNTAIDYYRKNKKLRFQADSEYIDKMGEVLEEADSDDSEYAIDTSLIIKEVQELSPAYRTIFNLYVVEGYSHREIAETLGISEGTSKSNLAKAKKNLKTRLKQYNG